MAGLTTKSESALNAPSITAMLMIRAPIASGPEASESVTVQIVEHHAVTPVEP